MCGKPGDPDSVIIGRAKQPFSDPNVQAGVVTIASFFSDILRTITALEEHGLSLDESTRLVEDLAKKMIALAESLHPIREKRTAVFLKNTIFNKLSRVRDFVQENVRDEISSMSVEDIPDHMLAARHLLWSRTFLLPIQSHLPREYTVIPIRELGNLCHTRS